ncbi:unnamed protein product [Medioppia subpectinata]|uniref:RING-type E3 ubiquitin transferase (cysteine targeting) n=1 Tax=Medioppia subpectinata TaxID=1979941 RepID=A0A7R9L0F8_9ACAR|nr:unnamed protein product [Medioppia subpectinata]CAG2112032.1 unnamed protein product [Medioppia subpectinata]
MMAEGMDTKAVRMDTIYSLRVNQIDSKSLDSELNAMIETKVNDLESDALRGLSPEVMAFIKAYIWMNTVHRKGSSIGQALLELKYYDLSDNTIVGHLNAYQKSAMVCTQIVFPWLQQRVNSHRIGHYIHIIDNLYKTCDLINGLIFLYNGKYRTCWEAVMRMGTGVQSDHHNWSHNELYLEIMNRELLWHTFAQLLSFVLPLINWYRLKNSCVNTFRSLISSSRPTIESNIGLRVSNDLNNCVICNEWPINGHEIGCRHVFCYYCLMSNFMSDPMNGFTSDNKGIDL